LRVNNQPYSPLTIRPVEELLLRRLEAVEMGLTQLAQVVTNNLPSTHEAVNRIMGTVQQAGAIAQELAACLYLEQLDPSKADGPATPAHVLYSAAQEATEALNLTLGNFFPGLVLQGNPLGLDVEALFKQWPSEPLVLGEAGTLVSYAQLSTSPGALPLGGCQLYTTGLINPQRQMSKTLILRLSDTLLLAIAPALSSWQLITIDYSTEHYFFHHNGALVDRKDVLTILRHALVQKLPAKTRSMFRDSDSLDTQLTVALAKVFKHPPGRTQTVERDGLYQYTVGHSMQQDQSQLLSIRNHQSPFTVLIGQAQPDTLMIGSSTAQGSEQNVFQRMAQVPLDQLPVQSKHLLLELLAPLNKKAK
jgi:hypothetical protein